jgi:fatty-acid desaturase
MYAAGEGSSTETAEQALVTIGDKGRAQLQRIAADRIRLSVAETYKDRVTFSQVGCETILCVWWGGQTKLLWAALLHFRAHQAREY